MKFYTVNNTGLNKDDFIKTYGESYFLNTKRLVPRISQNSVFAENEIERLLKNGIRTNTDVMHVLSWKIGKINHRDTDAKQKFEYHKDWQFAEQLNVKRYGKDFDVKGFINYITSNINFLEKTAKTDPQEVLNLLNKNSPPGIGTVYLITLLYFISKGTYPIYDRFAMKAIDAVLNEATPGSPIQYKELPEKKSKQFGKIMCDNMSEYICKLEKIFGTEYQSNRNIDRALWVYGHLFPDEK